LSDGIASDLFLLNLEWIGTLMKRMPATLINP
jgi:hypothetical protein